MSLPQLMRKLATASDHEEELSTQRIRGQVDWSRTLALRSTAGASDLYVTAPPRRVYQTPENELLVHVLDAIVQGSQRTWVGAANASSRARHADPDAAGRRDATAAEPDAVQH